MAAKWERNLRDNKDKSVLQSIIEMRQKIEKFYEKKIEGMSKH